MTTELAAAIKLLHLSSSIALRVFSSEQKQHMTHAIAEKIQRSKKLF